MFYGSHIKKNTYISSTDRLYVPELVCCIYLCIRVEDFP